MLANNCSLDSTIDAAREIGMRFHAARGAMSRGAREGGLPPDSCVEQEDVIVKDAERLIHRYHDNSRHAMNRIILARCSPFSVTPNLMREAAALARQHPGVNLHSHLAEELFEETYCQDRKSTRLNSSHQIISYAVFCLKKKKKTKNPQART